MKFSFHFWVFYNESSLMRLNRLISERFGSRLLDWLMSHRAAHHSSAAAGTRFQMFFRLFRRFLVFVARQFGNQIWKTSCFWKTTKNEKWIWQIAENHFEKKIKPRVSEQPFYSEKWRHVDLKINCFSNHQQKTS